MTPKKKEHVARHMLLLLRSSFVLPQLLTLNQKRPGTLRFQVISWQGKKASNPRPTVLETAALPAELFPCVIFKMVDRQGLEPRTDRL